MKIIGCDIYTFNLPLLKPFFTKGKWISNRKGFLLRLNSSDGAAGFGEISPLPAFSRESLREVRIQLQSLAFKNFKTIPQLFPSVRFGLESALWNLLADQKKFPLQKILSPSQKINRKNIPVIGLLQGSLENVVSETKRMKARGFRDFKLKVGTNDMAQDIEKVRRVQALLKNRGTLRLDANQFWTFEEAISFAKAVEKDSIEYIEEPFKDIFTQRSLITQFFQTTGIPVALDESLRGMDPEHFKPFPGLKAVILKPTILGGIEKTFRWVKKAKELKVQAVISSTFESGVGLSMLAQLAAALECFPVGVDTYKWFLKDILIRPIKMVRGNLIVPAKSLRETDLDFSMLKTVV